MADRADVIAGQAVRVLAEIERLQLELDAGELVVSGSRGQPVPNPLLGQLRAHRWLLVRLAVDAPGGGCAVSQPVADAVDQIRGEWLSSGVS